MSCLDTKMDIALAISTSESIGWQIYNTRRTQHVLFQGWFNAGPASLLSGLSKHDIKMASDNDRVGNTPPKDRTYICERQVI